MVIKVSKSAEVKISPDTAVFNITLSRRGASEEAYTAVAALAEAVKKRSESIGVTIKFKNTMMREKCAENEKDEYICSVDAEARILISDMKALTAFEMILSENQARFFLCYDASNKESAHKQALALALEGARKNATEIADQLGKKLSAVETVEYRSDYAAMPMMMRSAPREELAEISVRESVEVTFTAV